MRPGAIAVGVAVVGALVAPVAGGAQAPVPQGWRDTARARSMPVFWPRVTDPRLRLGGVFSYVGPRRARCDRERVAARYTSVGGRRAMEVLEARPGLCAVPRPGRRAEAVRVAGRPAALYRIPGGRLAVLWRVGAVELQLQALRVSRARLLATARSMRPVP